MKGTSLKLREVSQAAAASRRPCRSATGTAATSGTFLWPSTERTIELTIGQLTLDDCSRQLSAAGPVEQEELASRSIFYTKDTPSPSTLVLLVINTLTYSKT